MNEYFKKKDVLKNMLDRVSSNLKRKLVRSEIESFVSHVKKIDYDIYARDFTENPRFKNLTLEQYLGKVEDMTIKSFIEKLVKYVNDDEIVDIKELLKNEIQKTGDNSANLYDYSQDSGNGGNGGSGNGGGNGGNGGSNSGGKSSGRSGAVVVANPIAIDEEKWHMMQRTLGREQLIRSANLYFDSRYRDRTDSNTDRYVFHFNNTYSRREGTVNALGDIRDIIEMEIYPFELPFTQSTTNHYNKITMLVGEFKQGFISTEVPEFHFIFNTSILSNNTVRLTPVNPIYKLRDPITRLDRLTLQFNAPLIPVVFSPDIIDVTITYTNPATFTASISHQLETGDLVYFTDFTTNNPSADNSTIIFTNRIEGHTINKVSSTEFNCPILDFTTLTPMPLTYTTKVYLGSKRALIPIRFGYILPQKNLTDY